MNCTGMTSNLRSCFAALAHEPATGSVVISLAAMPQVPKSLVPMSLLTAHRYLLDFPTMIFYETGYSLHTLRQASRRSWRIGQKKPVLVKFMFYKGTFQERCIAHMGMKMLVSGAMEGKFSGEGLSSMGNEDMMTSLARELVEQGHVGDSANKIWSDLRAQRELLFEEAVPVLALPAPPSGRSAALMLAAPAVVAGSAVAVETAVVVEEVVTPFALPPAPATPQSDPYGLAAFAASPARLKRAAVACPDQLMLFLQSGGQGIPALYNPERYI